MPSLNTNLNITGRAIQSLFEQYISGALKVNREYQRKLVWTRPEKESFVQSIIQDLPVPLILTAEVSSPAGIQIEIIDGLQRLNAIFSFIQGEYSVDGKFFDPETLAETLKQRDAGEYAERTPVWDRDTCISFAAYSIPVSTYRTNHKQEIEEIFRRINSNGRHLSRQEIRQAGSTAPVAPIVRRASTIMRGDYSMDDLVDLKDMGKISLSDDGSGPGLDINSIFWVRHGILTKEDMRRSRDEEIVLDIVTSMALGENTTYASQNFDEYYGLLTTNGTPTERKDRLDTRLQILGSDQIEARVSLSKSIFDDIFDPATHPFSTHFFSSRRQRVARYYESVFLAIDALAFGDKLEIFDVAGARARLNSVGSNHLDIPGGSGTWTGASKAQNVSLVRGLLAPYFRPQTGTPDPALENSNAEVLTLLSASRVEHARFELKHGLSTLSDPPRPNNSIVLELAKTLSAMTNAGPGLNGHVLVGVADKQMDAQRVEQLTGEAVPISQPSERYITGLNIDCNLHGDIEAAVMWFTNKFREIEMTPWLKSRILDNLRVAQVEDRYVLKMTVRSGDAPTQVNGNKWKILSEAGILHRGSACR